MNSEREKADILFDYGLPCGYFKVNQLVQYLLEQGEIPGVLCKTHHNKLNATK